MCLISSPFPIIRKYKTFEQPPLKFFNFQLKKEQKRLQEKKQCKTANVEIALSAEQTHVNQRVNISHVTRINVDIHVRILSHLTSGV